MAASGPVANYQCIEAAVRRAAKPCQSFQGRGLDAAISALLLDKVAPAALEVAVQVHDEIAARIEQADALRRKQLEGSALRRRAGPPALPQGRP